MYKTTGVQGENNRDYILSQICLYYFKRLTVIHAYNVFNVCIYWGLCMKYVYRWGGII